MASLCVAVLAGMVLAVHTVSDLLPLAPTVALLNPGNGTVVMGSQLEIRYVINLPETPQDQQDRVAAQARERLRVCFMLDDQEQALACTPLNSGEVVMKHLLPGRRRLEARVLDTGMASSGAGRVVARDISVFDVRLVNNDGTEDEHNIDFYAHRGNAGSSNDNEKGGSQSMSLSCSGDDSNCGEAGVSGIGGTDSGGTRSFRSRFFDGVYRFSVWAGGSRSQRNGIPDSGPGSTTAETRAIRAALPEILSGLGIRTMIDVPCGDMSWMQLVDLSGIRYIGADISPRVVEQNRRRLDLHTRQSRTSSTDNAEHGHVPRDLALVPLHVKAAMVEFRVLDLVEEAVPSGVDLVFCRHLMFHLTPEHNMRVLRHIERSTAKYALLSTYLRTNVNTEPFVLVQGHHINLMQPPYCLKDPVRLYSEDHFDMYMGLWELGKEGLLGNCTAQQQQLGK